MNPIGQRLSDFTGHVISICERRKNARRKIKEALLFEMGDPFESWTHRTTIGKI